MTTPLFHIARPVTLWSLHFIGIYALISAACAPRGLIDVDLMRPIAAIGTMGMSVLMLVWLLQAMRRAKSSDGPEDRALSAAVLWSVIISFLAILLNLWPIATLATCTGL